MAIAFQNNKYDIMIDSNMIVGVMGDYDDFFASLSGDNIYFIDKRVSTSNKIVSSLFDIEKLNIKKLLKDFNLKEEILNKEINELSHSEQKLLKYLLMLISDRKIVIIDEPFLDLDYGNKKTILLLFNRLIKNNKTIIVGSVDSNIIYSLCKRVLFINNSDCYYDEISIFKDKSILRKYHVAMPNIVKFIELAKDKKIKLKDSRDIRELIKDVYRNVSKK